MAFVVIKKGNYFYVKNTKTGKVGSNKFKEKKMLINKSLIE